MELAQAPRHYTGASLWHLWLAEPEVCRQHLLPLLEALRPDWRLKERVAQIEEELLKAAAAGQLPDRQGWTALVAQLSDDRFSKREAADRELRALGPIVVPFLERLDLARLEPEQQLRVRRILTGMRRDMEEDPPQQVAAWLTADAGVWLAMLDRPQESTRRAAKTQLARLLGTIVQFDPAAPPEVRRRQARAAPRSWLR